MGARTCGRADAERAADVLLAGALQTLDRSLKSPTYVKRQRNLACLPTLPGLSPVPCAPLDESASPNLRTA